MDNVEINSAVGIKGTVECSVQRLVHGEANAQGWGRQMCQFSTET